jgi:hypothetical protein
MAEVLVDNFHSERQSRQRRKYQGKAQAELEEAWAGGWRASLSDRQQHPLNNPAACVEHIREYSEEHDRQRWTEIVASL